MPFPFLCLYFHVFVSRVLAVPIVCTVCIVTHSPTTLHIIHSSYTKDIIHHFQHITTSQTNLTFPSALHNDIISHHIPQPSTSHSIKHSLSLRIIPPHHFPHPPAWPATTHTIKPLLVNYPGRVQRVHNFPPSSLSTLLPRHSDHLPAQVSQIVDFFSFLVDYLQVIDDCGFDLIHFTSGCL